MMTDTGKVIGDLEGLTWDDWHEWHSDSEVRQIAKDAIELLKEQDELLKHEYWRGYNNGRADERGLQEGTIMQTFSPD